MLVNLDTDLSLSVSSDDATSHVEVQFIPGLHEEPSDWTIQALSIDGEEIAVEDLSEEDLVEIWDAMKDRASDEVEFDQGDFSEWDVELDSEDFN